MALGQRLELERLAAYLVEERMGVNVHARLLELGLLALLPRRTSGSGSGSGSGSKCCP